MSFIYGHDDNKYCIDHEQNLVDDLEVIEVMDVFKNVQADIMEEIELIDDLTYVHSSYVHDFNLKGDVDLKVDYTLCYNEIS